MARTSDIGSQLGQLVGTLAFVWFITVGISDHFGISRLLSFAVLVGIVLTLLAIARAFVSISAVIERNKRCAHGVRRGKDGGCERCVADEEKRRAEEERRQAEWQASQAIRERLATVKNEAAALRLAELHALTQRWLSRSE